LANASQDQYDQLQQEWRDIVNSLNNNGLDDFVDATAKANGGAHLTSALMTVCAAAVVAVLRV
jgi:hypothetical protein